MTTSGGAMAGYRDMAVVGIRERAREEWERIIELEARTTLDFWEHSEFAELAKLRAMVAAAQRTIGEGNSISEMSDVAFEAIAAQYEQALKQALVAAQALEEAAENTFGELPESPRCTQSSASWFAKLFTHTVPDEDLADLTAEFDKYLHRMDKNAERMSIGRGVHSAKFIMREVPFRISVRWEALDQPQLWRISVPTRVGLRPFSVTPQFFSHDSAAAVADSATQARALANEIPEPIVHAQSADSGLTQADEFRALLRITGNQDAAQRVLNFDVRGYLLELVKATTPALVVGEGRATIAFAQSITEDLLKYSLRVLMAAHAAPAELQLVR
jgi:hypothetical protein